EFSRPVILLHWRKEKCGTEGNCGRGLVTRGRIGGRSTIRRKLYLPRRRNLYKRFGASWARHILKKEFVPPRILIAEDRPTMRNALRSLFTLYSKWEVCAEATDGRQAVDAAVALRPDLVLLDYKMPNGNGIEAASELKKKLPNTPVVIFTLYKTRELESEARQVGVRAVVGKEEGVIKTLSTIEGELTPPLV